MNDTKITARPERRKVICDGVNKTCTKCDESKPLCEFHKSAKCWTGHANKCKECIKKESQLYYLENHKHIKKTVQKWNVKNKDKRAGYKRKNKENESKKARRRCSVQIGKYLRVKHPTEKIHKLISCTTATLKKHIESQFTEGMTWENRGAFWQIDHIIPMSLFDMMDEEQKLKANHYTNLRPLHKEINGLMTPEQKAMYLERYPRVTDIIDYQI